MQVTNESCYFISAGEFSGDLLAAELVHALKPVFPTLIPIGITGPTMSLSGVKSLATTDELSVMGVIEVARKVCDIRMLEQRITTWVQRTQPKFAVLVDFPGFHFRLAEIFHMLGIPVFQYVAPKVWAWGRGRIPALRENFAQVLGVLPFEGDFFREHGVPYTYVGSPHWDRMSKLTLSSRDIGFPPDRPIVAFLPGSRLTELQLILPQMVAIRREVLKRMPDALCVIPLAPSLEWEKVAAILGHQDPVHATGLGWEAAGFWWLPGWSLELMKIARVAVVASGTATLECALAGAPMVVVYVMNDLSYAIARRAVKLKWVSLVNLLMNEEVVQEHIQVINVSVVADQISELIEDSVTRRRMVKKFDELAAKLVPGAAMTAAAKIKEILQQMGQSP